jgi:allophanate hydrolase subunit 2
MTVTTNEYGQQNMFAKETQPWISKTDAERYGYQTHAEKAELWNGRSAMMGILFGAISYTFTGNLFFGLF